MAVHREEHQRRLAEYLATGADPGLDRFQRATLTFGIHYEQAVLAWMDELPALLESGTTAAP